MNWLMRRLLGFHPMMAIEGDGTEGGGGAPDAEVVLDDGEAAPDPGEAAEPAPGAQTTKDKAPAAPVESAMLEGIKQALNPPDPEAQKKALHGAAAASARKKADDDFATSMQGKSPEEVASATAAREAEAKKKADADELAKLKGKKADDFLLSPEEKKKATQEFQQRMHQLHRYAKENETAVARLTQENAAISKARDEIMGIFTEHHVEPEDLGALLDYNRRIKTGDLAGALQVIEAQRSALYKAMGREPQGGGIDLIAEFPDLQQRVKDLELSRADAIELANGRRRDAAAQQAAAGQGRQQQSAQASKKAEEDEINAIDAWGAEMAKKDIDYKKKEEKILAAMPDIVKEFPIGYRLKAMQRMYGAIEIVKPSAPAPGGAPLRPSGARPGARTFNELTPDALRAGLGYPEKAA